MPIVEFDTLPATSRVWIFASDRPLTGGDAERLLGEADRFLAGWKAHGEPLTCGSAWLEDRFLVIAVDQSQAHASGCSVDGLFRALQEMQRDLGAQIVGGGRVFYRAAGGAVRCIARGALEAAVRDGQVAADTPVFDTSLTTLGEWRERFEQPARESWVAKLAPVS